VTKNDAMSSSMGYVQKMSKLQKKFSKTEGRLCLRKFRRGTEWSV